MTELETWKLNVYDSVVSDEGIHALVWRHLEGSQESGGPKVLEMDVAAGRKYLRRCMLNMSQIELQALSSRDAAALWARGAQGAAIYRNRRR